MTTETPATRDRGEATMWIAIATPIIMIAALVLFIVIWRATNLLFGLIVLGALFAAAFAVFTKRRNRYRGL